MGKQHNEGPTTQFYDIIYKKYLGKRTEKDVELIFDAIKNKIRKPFSEVKVLDIGCGSGRLSLLLLKKDITAYGIDISKIMINNFKKKLEKNRISAKLFNEDFLTTRKLNINYYDCIICFFNTFCEIALDGNSALKVLEKMKKLLTKNGIIILEMSNPRAFDPSNLDETWITKNNETEYLSNFKVERYENITGTTESMEKVIVKKKNKKTEFVSSHLKQKWWTFDEMCLLFEISGLKPIEFYADHKKYEPKTKNADEMLFVVKKK